MLIQNISQPSLWCADETYETSSCNIFLHMCWVYQMVKQHGHELLGTPWHLNDLTIKPQKLETRKKKAADPWQSYPMVHPRLEVLRFSGWPLRKHLPQQLHHTKWGEQRICSEQDACCEQKASHVPHQYCHVPMFWLFRMGKGKKCNLTRLALRSLQGQ